MPATTSTTTMSVPNDTWADPPVNAVPPLPPPAPWTEVDGFGETGYVDCANAFPAVTIKATAAKAITPVTRFNIFDPPILLARG